jgi:hypothetical protein
VKSRLDLAVSDLGATQLKNIAEPVRVYSLEVGKAAQERPTTPAIPKQRSKFVLLGAGIVALVLIAGSAWYFLGGNRPATVTSNAPRAGVEPRIFPSWCCLSPTSRAIQARIISPTASPRT